MAEQVHRGLDGIVVTESSLSRVDGDVGQLIYRGYPIETLANDASYEEVLHLLWNGHLPDASELAAFERALVADRAVDPTVLSVVETLADADEAPMAALRTAVSSLSSTRTDGKQTVGSMDDAKDHARRITAKLPTILAAFDRYRNGHDPIAPRDDLSHAANFLYMLTGEEPDAVAVETLDTALVLHADHGINASTFSAIVTASTLSDIYSAVTSAIGTLAGPLHGGATQNVMEMLLTIDESEQSPDEWIRDAIANEQLVPGFGHRVYDVKDPRAYILGEMSESLGDVTGDRKWFEYSQTIEDVMVDITGIPPNVDFYSATTYYQMGIAPDLFTPIFAVSRVGGWTAHVFEQYEDNRIMRPRGRYIGPESQEFVPLPER